jgi:hypothetical protein
MNSTGLTHVILTELGSEGSAAAEAGEESPQVGLQN